jgi:hypothetical protein
MPTPGLNLSSINQNLAAAGNTQTNYATENYVNDTLQTILTQGPVVDINITGNGLCVSTGICGTTKTVIDIGISTTLGDLFDVDVPSPVTNQYLKWNGTSWIAGNGVSTFSITDLTNFDAPSGALTPDAFLQVNNQGTCIIMTTTDVISNVVSGNGILVTTPSTGVRTINSDISNLTTVLSSSDNSNNYFSIETSTGDTRKIQKNQISLTGFEQSNFVTSSNISTNVTGGGPSTILTHTTSGPCVTITLDTTDILLATGGTGNILPVTRGGTSSGTSEGARENLGLVYNQDVITYSGGRYQNTLAGDNIKLIGGLSGTSIVSGGSNYGGSGYTGTCLLGVSGYDFNLNVNINSGVVASIIGISPVLSLAENIPGVSLTGFGGSGAVVDLGVCYSYLSFGVSSGDTNLSQGYGIRYKPESNLVEIKSSDTGSDWVSLTNKFGVSGLTDVGISIPPTGGEILIYNGTSNQWQNKALYISTGAGGGGTLGSDGVIDLTLVAEGISVASGPCITTQEFTRLQGISSNIQEQLNQKIEVNSNLIQGNVIMYNGFTSGVSQFTKVPSGSTASQSFNFLKETNPSGGVSEAIFENIYYGFDHKPNGTNIGSSSRFCILDVGTPQANSFTLFDTSTFLTNGTSTGLNSNAQGQIALNYNQLDQATTISEDNLISFGISASTGNGYVQSISVEDFLSSSLGTSQGGLSISGGKIQLKIPTVENSSSITSPYDGQLAYFYNTTTPVGLSVLAVHYSSNWYGTCVSLVT